MSGYEEESSMMPGEAGFGSLTSWLLMTSGVTCAAVIVDVASRYIFRSTTEVETEEKRLEIKKKEEALLSSLKAEVKNSVKVAIEDTKELLVKRTTREYTEEDIARYNTLGTIEEEVEIMKGKASETCLVNGAASEEVSERARCCCLLPNQSNELLGNLAASLRTQVCIDGKSIAENGMKNMASILEYTNVLSNGYDRSGVKAKEATFNNGASVDLKTFQCSRLAILGRWTVLRRMLYCADVHLVNASLYHQFYLEANEYKQLIEKRAAEVDKCDTDTNEAERLDEALEDLQMLTNECKMLRMNLVGLREISTKVIPVNQRTTPSQDPIACRALACFKNDEIAVSEGDALLLTDNSNKHEWQVTTSAGEKGLIPAVLCLVPGPDEEALELMKTLWSSYEEYSTTLTTKYELVQNKLEEVSNMKKSIQAQLTRESEEVEAEVNQDSEEVVEHKVRFEYVIDTATGKQITLENAIQRGILNAEMSEFYDTKNRERMNIFAAFGRGLVIPASSSKRTIQEKSSDYGVVEIKVTTATTFHNVETVLDPRKNQFIDVNTAIAEGIWDEDKQLYKDPVSGAVTNLQNAILTGLLKGEEVELNGEGDGGTVETRKFKVHNVTDSETGKKVSFQTAIEGKIINMEDKTYMEKGKPIGIGDAIRKRYLSTSIMED